MRHSLECKPKPKRAQICQILAGGCRRSSLLAVADSASHTNCVKAPLAATFQTSRRAHLRLASFNGIRILRVPNGPVFSKRMRSRDVRLLANELLVKINREFAAGEPGYRDRTLSQSALRSIDRLGIVVKTARVPP